MRNKFRSYSFLCALLLGAFVVVNNLAHRPNNILCWDVYGYYLYLPQAFIQDDLAIRDTSVTMNLARKYESTGSFYQAMRLPDGKHVMKYSMGMAVLYAPWFLAGHAAAKVTDAPQDGFSAPYREAVFWGCIVYSLIGIWVLRRVLLRFYSEVVSSLVLALVVFGTNYYMHVTIHGQNAMSHNLLFSLYAIILWTTIRWHESRQWKHVVGLGIACGLAILARPTEALCLMIPALWQVQGWVSLKEKIALLWAKKLQIGVFSLLLFVILGMQLVYWKAMSGKFLYNSYGGNPGEGLNFNYPHLWEVLFSFRKGWLLYTPLMAAAIMGLVMLVRQQKAAFWALGLFFLVNLYVISCWSTWWYGPSFSQRPFISTYPIMAIGLGAFITWALQQKIALKGAFAALAAIFVALNLFQTQQYLRGIIDIERMTREAYFETFLSLDTPPDYQKMLLVDRSRSYTAPIQYPELYESRPHWRMDFEEGGAQRDTLAHGGRYSQRLDGAQPIGFRFIAPYSELTDQDHAYLRISAWVYPQDSNAVGSLQLVAEFLNKNWGYGIADYRLDSTQVRPGQWNRVQYDYLTPVPRYPSNPAEIYFALLHPAVVWVDDWEIEVLERKR